MALMKSGEPTIESEETEKFTEMWDKLRNELDTKGLLNWEPEGTWGRKAQVNCTIGGNQETITFFEEEGDLSRRVEISNLPISPIAILKKLIIITNRADDRKPDRPVGHTSNSGARFIEGRYTDTLVDFITTLSETEDVWILGTPSETDSKEHVFRTDTWTNDNGQIYKRHSIVGGPGKGRVWTEFYASQTQPTHYVFLKFGSGDDLIEYRLNITAGIGIVVSTGDTSDKHRSPRGSKHITILKVVPDLEE